MTGNIGSQVTTSVFGLVPGFYRELDKMRSPLVTEFHETLGLCFATTLRDMLGLAVCESVHGLLERNGIPRGESCNRFDDTVTVLTKTLGASSRVLVHRTVVEMFHQYSQRADFSYQDSLRDRLIVLKEAVVANRLIPKNQHDGIDFDSTEKRDLQAREKLATAAVPTTIRTR